MKANTIKFIFQMAKSFKFWVFGQLLVAVIWAIDLSLRPYLIKLMLDTVAVGNFTVRLSYIATAYVALGLLMVVVFRFYDWTWLHLNPGLKRHIGGVLVKEMMQHSQTLFQNNFAGNIGNKIKDVMSGTPDLIKIFAQTFASFLGFIISVFIVGSVNVFFSVALCVWVFIFITASILLSKRAKVLSEQAAGVRSNVVGQIIDILGNIMTVRLFAGASFESRKLKGTLDTWVKADQRRDWYFLFIYAVQGLSFVIYQSVCLFLLVYGFKEGRVTSGDFALILTVNMLIINFLWELSKDIGTIAEIVGNIAQGLNLVYSPMEITDKLDAKRLNLTVGEIKFNEVDFKYDKSNLLFTKKSITIASGQKVGLVGYSGSGKSTFVNLILRMFDVTSGSISIDGQDISNVSQDSLRECIGMIPQDPSLFHRSLMDNIRYSKPEASDDEVINAAKQAFAHEFIVNIAEGYNSLVGERGVKLSGGQRQRVAIARAILKDAPILILDEATSQLDSITESEIQESLWNLMQNKTTIVVAHRLSTLLHMDRVLVFDNGKVVEDGSHQELLAKSGLYKKMWDSQVGGFLPEKG